ncbi:MAG TPA: hypothetical protein VMG08_12830 [Allosphingosinicella sp.]|nr:hypothetical protein [Allosphingosinicella sp.]
MKSKHRQACLLALAVVLPGLAACSKPEANNALEMSALACTPPRANWMRQGNFDGLMPPINRLSLDRNGAIHWNGRVIAMRQLSEYLGIVHGMNPEPIVFLETEMGAPCARLEAIRDEMERRMECSNFGSCAEGIWHVWQATPTPPGTPPS